MRPQGINEHDEREGAEGDQSSQANYDHQTRPFRRNRRQRHEKNQPRSDTLEYAPPKKLVDGLGNSGKRRQAADCNEH